jgi:hypothetical protein
MHTTRNLYLDGQVVLAPITYGVPVAKPKWKILKELDDFTQQYLETALWSSTDPDTEVSLDDDYGIEDFTREFLVQAAKDCADFQRDNRELWEVDGKSDSSAGHDFWLNRNGHGAGFWDGDYPTNGDKLSDAAKVYGGLFLMPGRGRVGT